MDKQQIAKQALADTWAWATEERAHRSNARAFMGDYARRYKIDLDNLGAAPMDTDWAAFCEGLITGLNKDDRVTRECACEWSDGGWYDESSGRAASRLYFALSSSKSK